MNAPRSISLSLSAAIAALVALLVPAVAAAEMDAAPTSYDWGNVDRHQQSYQQSFQLSNTGSLPVIPIASISGADAGSFVITGDGCAGSVLFPGDKCSLNVHVSPASSGALSASLEVFDNDGGTVSVPLTADGADRHPRHQP